MLAFLNLAVIAFAEGGEAGGPLDVNPGLIFWTVITFITLLLILRFTAWKPILASLSSREDFIKDSLQKAENERKEAERLLEENKAAMAKAEDEAQKIIAQGREYGEKLKEQILEESRNESKKMIAAASAEIERKNQEAFESLKNQVASIAIGAAEKIIRENLDEEKQSKLVDKFIDELPNN